MVHSLCQETAHTTCHNHLSCMLPCCSPREFVNPSVCTASLWAVSCLRLSRRLWAWTATWHWKLLHVTQCQRTIKRNNENGRFQVRTRVSVCVGVCVCACAYPRKGHTILHYSPAVACISFFEEIKQNEHRERGRDRERESESSRERLLVQHKQECFGDGRSTWACIGSKNLGSTLLCSCCIV